MGLLVSDIVRYSSGICGNDVVTAQKCLRSNVGIESTSSEWKNLNVTIGSRKDEAPRSGISSAHMHKAS